MAVTFTIKTVAEQEIIDQQEQVHKPKSGELTEEQVDIDELIKIDQFMENHDIDLLLKRRDELKKKLQLIANEQPMDAPAKLEGSVGFIEFSKAGQKVVITDREAMVSKLTPELFIQVANVTVSDLKKYLSENEIDAFTDKEHGSRSYKGSTFTG